jgi:hypothetical protein
MVCVTIKHWSQHGPSRKPAGQQAGPFKILEKKRGNAFLVDLTQPMKVHRVLTANKLRKAHSEPRAGQVTLEPEPMEIDGEHQWQVEKILDCRNIRGKLKYQADWVRFDKEDKKSRPASNFCCPTIGPG